MTLVRTKYSAPLSSMFDDFVSNVFNTSRQVSPGCMNMDIIENEKDYVIKADLPGLTKADIKLSVEKNTLSIEAPARTLPQNTTKHHNERFCGPYGRSLYLPDTVDAQSINATMQDGVLSITIPKKPQQIRREISIN